MSHNIRKIWLAGRAAICRHIAVRHVAAWFAVLGLYAQLAAVGLCAYGLPLPAAAGNPGAFPICHSQASNAHSGHARNDHAPAHQQDCLFCVAHCHAAMDTAPSLSGLDAIHFVSVLSEAPAFIVPQAVRYPAGVSPRGPPVSI